MRAEAIGGTFVASRGGGLLLSEIASERGS
jgi:hypothetical protein